MRFLEKISIKFSKNILSINVNHLAYIEPSDDDGKGGGADSDVSLPM